VSGLLSAIVHLPRNGLMTLVRGYRFFFSPWVGQACRFTPTCSAYTLEALNRHGALAGTTLGAWRVLRCQPWCDGGHDPVPPADTKWLSRLLRKPPIDSLDKKNAS
jgi:putative membrane protein insertion efficiency factor